MLDVLIDIIAAFVASALAGTGIGGGGLLVIYLTAFRNAPQGRAQAMNLIFFISAALAALPYHVRHRRLNGRLILVCIALASLGTLWGGRLRDLVTPALLRRLFGVFLVSAGGYSLVKKVPQKSKKAAQKRGE